MKQGQELEHAVWYDANVDRNPVKSVGESIRDVVKEIASNHRLSIGPVKFRILKPDDERVPPVPRWLEVKSGAVPRLLVATAIVKKTNVKRKTEPSLVNDLEPDDLELMRAITRRKFAEFFPYAPEFQDFECDTMINALGVDVVMDEIRRARDNKSPAGTT